jgi:hypothetical protein
VRDSLATLSLQPGAPCSLRELNIITSPAVARLGPVRSGGSVRLRPAVWAGRSGRPPPVPPPPPQEPPGSLCLSLSVCLYLSLRLVPQWGPRVLQATRSTRGAPKPAGARQVRRPSVPPRHIYITSSPSARVRPGQLSGLSVLPILHAYIFSPWCFSTGAQGS